MVVAALTLDVLLGDVRSLKQKRAVVRPLVAQLRRCYPGVAVAETGHLDLHRRAEIGVAVVSATVSNATQVITECERLVAARPEIELLSARQRLFNTTDDLLTGKQTKYSTKRGDGAWPPSSHVSASLPTGSARSSPKCWSGGSRTRGWAS